MFNVDLNSNKILFGIEKKKGLKRNVGKKQHLVIAMMFSFMRLCEIKLCIFSFQILPSIKSSMNDWDAFQMFVVLFYLLFRVASLRHLNNTECHINPFILRTK